MQLNYVSVKCLAKQIAVQRPEYLILFSDCTLILYKGVWYSLVQDKLVRLQQCAVVQYSTTVGAGLVVMCQVTLRGADINLYVRCSLV